MIECASGLVTLYDMIPFNAAWFVVMNSEVGKIEGQTEVRRASAHANFGSALLKQDQITPQISSLKSMRSMLSECMFHSSLDMVDRIIRDLEGQPPMSHSKLLESRFELRRRMEDDLKRRFFYQLRTELASYYTAANPFGEPVAGHFRTAAHDLQEAARCYACERYDATVYHLMRAMESPLRCLAKTLQVKYTQGWAGYLNQIDKKLRDPKRRLTKKRKEFLSNASTLMWAVKDAWRNETMHLESVYGPDQTQRIFESTKAFMMHLATELHE